MLNNWKYFLSIKRNWLWLFFQSLILFVFLKVFELVIQFSHYRHSVQIKDWLFIIQPLDLSLAICIFTYSGILIAACYLIRTPEQFFNALNLYAGVDDHTTRCGESCSCVGEALCLKRRARQIEQRVVRRKDEIEGARRLFACHVAQVGGNPSLCILGVETSEHFGRLVDAGHVYLTGRGLLHRC